MEAVDLHRVALPEPDPTPFQIAQRDRNRRRFAALRLSGARRVAFGAWFYSTRALHLARHVLRGDRARAAAIWQGTWGAL